MSNNQKPETTKKGAGIAIAVCFLAAIIMAGTYALNGIQKAKQQELAQLEEEQSQAANAQELVINTQKEESEEMEMESEEPEEETTSVSAENISVNFSEQSQILWPVDGNVLMGYNMGQTVYFATLDQYKYNPATIIASVEGDQVIAGSSGIVKSIDVTAQTGTTVNIDLGNGYEVFYGQLKDVPLNVGDYVAANTVVGYVAQPTKYYVSEGCNLYFEMRKDGQPVNPVAYVSDDNN